MVLFTLHHSYTISELVFSLCIVGIIALIGSIVIQHMLENAKEKGYEKGFDAYAAEIADDIASDLEYFLQETSEQGDHEEQ